MTLYKQTITREDVEYSLINEDKNPLHRNEEFTKDFLKKINMENLGEGVIVPGA